MTNVVIPMAGLGSRFVRAGYTVPKPFIDVRGRPMVERVLENLSIPNARYILIVREEHIEAFAPVIRKVRLKWNVEVVPATPTEGAVCSVLLARKLIQSEDDLLIANSDQWVDFQLEEFLLDARERKLGGSILTFIHPERNPKWSFAQVDDFGNVLSVREKEPISDIATVGIYWFRTGRDFVESAIDLIVRNERVNGEFYVCPVYNRMIREGFRIGIFNVEESAMHGLGTPEDLNLFLEKFGEICGSL